MTVALVFVFAVASSLAARRRPDHATQGTLKQPASAGVGLAVLLRLQGRSSRCIAWLSIHDIIRIMIILFPKRVTLIIIIIIIIIIIK